MWPFKKSYPTCVSEVQKQIFESVRKGNVNDVIAAINKYNSVIKAEFPKWKQIPVEIRGTKHEKWYANGLIGLADVYRQCGETSYIQLLMRKQEDNPILKWQEIISSAQMEYADNRPGPALALINGIIPEINKLSGSAVDALLPICYGLAGAANYKIGDIEEAIKNTELALVICRNNNDAIGIKTYEANLSMMKGA